MQSFYSFGMAVIFAGVGGAMARSCAKNSDTIIRHADDGVTAPLTRGVIRHGGKSLNRDQQDD